MITVLTPTYNRANLLEKLYISLIHQTNKNFEWLVVDDGSSDDTEKVIEYFIAQDKIRIRYIKKQNGGKHTALNVGIKTVNSELIFIVDSDDYVTQDAVETIENYYEKYKNIKYICGFAFLRKYPDGQINGNQFKRDELIATYIDSRINCNDTQSDKAEVFFTQCLKEFPFPQFENEKFLGEDLVWIRMAMKYSMVHVNKAIYVGNYLDEGLTNNRRKHNIKSPAGCTERAKEFMRPQIKLRYRLKGGLQYIIYGKFSRKGIFKLLSESNNKFITLVCIPGGLFLYKKWRIIKA